MLSDEQHNWVVKLRDTLLAYKETHPDYPEGRAVTLANLLRPIQWSVSSSVRARQNEVSRIHVIVNNVYYFMLPWEKALADEWCKLEAHSDLWE